METQFNQIHLVNYMMYYVARLYNDNVSQLFDYNEILSYPFAEEINHFKQSDSSLFDFECNTRYTLINYVRKYVKSHDIEKSEEILKNIRKAKRQSKFSNICLNVLNDLRSTDVRMYLIKKNFPEEIDKIVPYEELLKRSGIDIAKLDPAHTYYYRDEATNIIIQIMIEVYKFAMISVADVLETAGVRIQSASRNSVISKEDKKFYEHYVFNNTQETYALQICTIAKALY